MEKHNIADDFQEELNYQMIDNDTMEGYIEEETVEDLLSNGFLIWYGDMNRDTITDTNWIHHITTFLAPM